MSWNLSNRIGYVECHLEKYPWLAAASVNNPDPESLDGDAAFTHYVVVPFSDESGLAVWMFETRPQRDVFVRRSNSHRPVTQEKWRSAVNLPRSSGR